MLLLVQIQLPKLDKLIDNRRETANFYLSYLSKYEEFFHFQKETPNGKHVWFGFPVILKDNTPFSVKDITSYMQKRGIETRPIIAGNMARHPAFKLYEHRIAGDLHNADVVMKKGFAFACHHAVDQKAREYIVQTIDAFIAEFLINLAFSKHKAKLYEEESPYCGATDLSVAT